MQHVEDPASESSDSSEEASLSDQNEEEEDEQIMPYDMETEDKKEDQEEDQKELPTKVAEKPPSSPVVNNLTSHEACSKDSKSSIFNCAFTNKEDYDYVHKLCNNNVIFHKIIIWMKEKLK